MEPVSLGGDRTHTAVLFSLTATRASAPIAAKSHSPADMNQVSGAGAAWGLAWGWIVRTQSRSYLYRSSCPSSTLGMGGEKRGGREGGREGF